MFHRTIFVCFVGFVLAKSVEQDQPEIKFEIQSYKDKKNNTIVCDHIFGNKSKNKYTVLEGETFTILTKYKSFINDLICSDYSNPNDSEYSKREKVGTKNETSFTAEKSMGTLWNCTMLTNRAIGSIRPAVHYKGIIYSAAYCFMQIHVRRTVPPQTILVNNMELQAVRTDLSEKTVDFTAEYMYADGDVVNVTCINFLEPHALTMEYEMAGTMSDNSTMADLSSNTAIGFVATLRSGHNNSYMICTSKAPTDYTKVMVRFVMRTEFKNIASIKINGMTLRPVLKNPRNNYHEIKYRYMSNQYIKVECEVQGTNAKLVVLDDLVDSVGKESSYKRKGPIEGKKAMMSFFLNTKHEKKLQCSSDDIDTGRSIEQVAIQFTAGKFSTEQYPLHMELPSNGKVLEVYNDGKKVIFYDFEDNETLELTCGPLGLPIHAGPVIYLQFNDSGQYCKRDGCVLPQKITLTEGKKITCCIKEQVKAKNPSIGDNVLRQVTVVFRKRVLTTTTTTTSTTSTSTTAHPVRAKTPPAVIFSGASSSESGGKDGDGIDGKKLAAITGAVLCIIVICVSTIIVKVRKRSHAQGGPHNPNYENLQNPGEASIPAYPPQWESNYAVPVDRRTDDTTYSVPCQEPALYSTPTPKNQRNKKQKSTDPTYAVLDVPNGRGRKNTFKETDDPNYSEVYANRQQQCYAEVLPKSVRNKMADNNPYSYVANEPPYANTAGSEPTYCEPAKAQAGTYANLNNSHYANSNATEYVEPTYCEPQKRAK